MYENPDMWSDNDDDNDANTATESSIITNPDLPVRKALFPAHSRKIQLTRSTELEDQLGAAYLRRVPELYRDTFKEYL